MRLEAAKYLFDVQSAARTLADFVDGRDWQVYQRDAMLRAAVERQFEIIGEAPVQLGRQDPDMPFFDSLKRGVTELKAFTLVAYYAARDPRTPWPVRLLALLVAAYALSPIDLIPDFIPVLGYLDDLILVPLGLALMVRLLPPVVLASAREQARLAAERPTSKVAAVVIGAVWLAVLVVVARWMLAWVRG